MAPVSVLVADAQLLLAESLVAALGGQEEVQPLEAVACTGADAVELAVRHRPDVVVLDHWILGPMNGVAATAAISEQSPDTEILVLSATPAPQQVQATLTAGAAGFVPKSLSVTELVDGIHRAHAGESPVFGERLWRMVETLNERGEQTEDVDRRLANLSERELEIVSLLTEGHSARNLARELFITEGTLRNHLHSILKKTGAASQQDLMRIVRNGMPVSPGVETGPSPWEPPVGPGEGITVLVADQQRLFAEALGQALVGFTDLAVLGAYSGNGIAPMHAAIRLAPKVLVYDYWMPATTSRAVVQYLALRARDTRVVLTSWLHGPAQVTDAALSGAAGLVPKKVSLADLADSIRDAAADRPLLHAEKVSERQADPFPVPPVVDWELPRLLAPRELEVLQWVGQGRSFQEISREMGISAGTVKNHLSSVLTKTGSSSRMEAVELARQAGLVREPGVPAT